MSKTLLSYTQDILNHMVSDEVNSISDSAEAEIVARIVLSTYSAMMSNRDWPHLRQLFQVTGFADSERPTHLKVPDNVKKLLSIQYNKQRSGETRLRYEDVSWKEPESFLRLINPRDSDATNIKTVTDPTGIKLLIRTDIQPTYYTSFDDETIVMDAVDQDVDSTLHASKITSFGYIKPTTVFRDDYQPDLPLEAEAALFEEALSTAQFRINTFSDVKAEQNAVRQNRWLSQNSWKVNGGIRYLNFGRNSGSNFRKGGNSSEPTFRRD